jgi:hypothetical protein
MNRKARKGLTAATRESIQIKAKLVVKLRVAKAAKDGILGTKKDNRRLRWAEKVEVPDRGTCLRARPESRLAVDRIGRRRSFPLLRQPDVSSEGFPIPTSLA